MNHSPLTLGILGSTRGTDMAAIIDAIANGRLNARVAVAISNKPDAGILEKAKKAKVDALFIDPTGKTREQFDKAVSEVLHKHNVNLILLIGYMRILSKPFVECWRDRILNVHPSLLPAFAGGMDMNVHEEVLKAGVKETGCTIHVVDETVDGGQILVQKRCPVLPNDTAETLKERVQNLEGEAFIEAIQKFQQGTL